MRKTKTDDSQKFIPVLKNLSRSVREYKKPSFLAPAFVMLETVIECLIPWIMTLLLGVLEIASGREAVNSDAFLIKLLDFLTGGAENPSYMLLILEFGAILMVFATISLFCGIKAGKYTAIASSGFAKNLRKDMYYKIQDFSFSNIDKFSTSSLVTRLTTDVTNVEMSYMMIIRTAIRAPFMMIFAMIMAFTINAKMALIFVCIAPLLAFGLIMIMVKAIPFFQKIFKKYDAMNESVEENIRGIRVVKSYVREDYEKDKFRKASDEVKKNFTKAEKLVALNTPIMNFCTYTGIILIFVVGSALIIKSENTLLQWTELQSFMTYSFQILMSLMMLSMIMVMLVISVASAKRISEVLNEESSIVSPDNALTEVKDGSVSFNNVAFKYNKKADRYSVEKISFDIKSGETVGIIGATGSGKTTMVSLIPRLYDVTEGSVNVGGHNVKEYDLNALRNAVAMVLQKNVLFSGTIRENLKWGNKDATDEEIFEAAKLSQAHEFVLARPNGYDTVIEQGGTNVSGGQKQRLCIARALLKKPKILILDDSTSAVDTHTDALIRQGLKKYVPETTKIIIAQRIASVQDADKIIIMENGTIAAMGNHEELLKNNKIYQELYYTQNKIESEQGGEK
ncbi:MAG: ABC transporter ATP-binding protein [Clostridia bacterium]|nr:ABC transporter ATP-binding protein [Clostridia bacterium]